MTDNTSPLNYKIQRQDADAPYAVLIHGLFGSLDNLTSLGRTLAESFNVLLIDLPDHGKSAHSEQFSFERYAQLIVDLLDQLSIQRCFLVGHSLGGKVAMSISLAHPQRIERLVVADISPVAYHSRHDNVFKGLNAVELATLSSRNEADQLMGQHIVEPGVRQFLLKSLYRENEQWNWRFNLRMLQRDYLNVLGAIEADTCYEGPVLFVKGSESDYVLSEHRPHIASLFPNSQAKIIQGTGHWLHAEKPTVFNRIVSGFLSK